MGKLKQELEKIMKDMRPPNIAVIGRTGAGKSSLINAIFGEDLAKTGTGLPVSTTFIRYPNSSEKKSPVIIYDSAGYEMGKEARFKENLFSFVEEHKSSIEEQIHLVWYVVHAGLKRFEDFDADIIKFLRSNRIPTLIVLSQVDLARANEIAKIEATIRNYESVYKLDEFDVLRVSSNPISGEPFGVIELVNTSTSLLPELYSEAFIARQIINLEAKKRTALKYIRYAALAAFAVGYVPIPATSAAAVIASQTTLLAKIASLYSYSEWTEILDEVGRMTLASITTYLATTFMDILSLLFLPGSLITGTLSGAAAATYIVVIGLSYTSVFEQLAQKELSGSGEEEIKEFISETFKKEFKKYSRLKIKSSQDLEKLDQFV